MLHNTSSISSSSLPFSHFFSPAPSSTRMLGLISTAAEKHCNYPQQMGECGSLMYSWGLWEAHTLSSVSCWDFFSVSALFYSSFTFSFLQQSLCLFHAALLSTPLKCCPSPPFLIYALLLLSSFLLLFDFFCWPLDEALLSLSCCTLPLTPLRSHSCM